MYDLSMWALILGLVAMNAFFVAAEFALVKVRISQLLARARQGSRAAKVAAKMSDHLDAYLSATQLGITVASLGLGWIGEPYLAGLIERGFALVGLAEMKGLSHFVAFPVALAVITALHLVWGELAPKNLAISRPETTSLLVAMPLRLFYIAFYPFIATLNELANISLRAVGIEPVAEAELALSEEELRLAFAHAHKRGHLTGQERRLMENVLTFAHMRAREIMLPRTEIVCLSTADSLEDNVEKALESGHTRLPVIEGDLDHVVGYVHVKDLAQLLLSPKPWDKGIQHFCRPVDLLSEHIALSQLLVHFQRQRSHLAMLVDEYGGIAGMVTLEMVLEQLVGAIQDEFDSEQPLIRPLQRGRFAIDGKCPLAVVANRCGVAFSPTEADTIGGFVTERLGRIPEPGERISEEAMEIVVTGSDGRRVTAVELSLKLPEEGETGE